MRPMCHAPGVHVVALVPAAGPVPPPHHGRNPAEEGFFHQLWADEVDVHIEPARGHNLSFGRDGLRSRTDNDIDAGLNVRISGLADTGDPSIADTDIGLDDPPMIDDQGVGDHRVHGAVGTRDLTLPHPVADDLAAPELDLLAVKGPVFLDLNEEVGIGETHPVPYCGSEHAGVGRALDLTGHFPYLLAAC